jgi:hypothetical protein
MNDRSVQAKVSEGDIPAMTDRIINISIMESGLRLNIVIFNS